MRYAKSDTQICADVMSELRWDARVDPSTIGVAVHDSIVTLTGTVTSYAGKVAAEEAAHRVSGVLDVANDVAVDVPLVGARKDADLAAAVRHALQWDVFVPDDKIQSTVSNGVVTLLGHVPTHAQREDAARAVRNFAGVRAIDNEITVEANVSPAALRAAIQCALERHADRDAERILIDVEGGRVTLEGDVHSWKERKTVIGAVTGTHGVQNVVDHLRIV